MMAEEPRRRATVRIKDMDLDARPRERAIAAGSVTVLNDAELLAIILNTGTQGCSVLDMARQILRQCNNSLATISQLSLEGVMDLCKGIGPAKAVSLQAAITLGMRAQQRLEFNDQMAVSSARDIFNDMRSLAVLDHEEFWVLYMTQAHRVKQRYRVSSGGTVATVVDVKMVMKRALELSAAAMILVHNHPSGNTQPSPQDDNLTRRLQTAAEYFDMHVLDHVVIGGASYYSYADNGRL